MKILIVSPKFHPIIGGGETYVLNSAKYLFNEGVEVSIAVEPHVDRHSSDYPYNVYEVPGLSDTNLDITTAANNLHGLLSTLQPDIIHVHGYFALLAIGLANDNAISVIASIHSTPVWGKRIIGGMDSFAAELQFARGALRAGYPKIVTAANQVYANAAKKVVRKLIPVVTLPYPVDIDHFYGRDDAGLRSELGVGPNDRLIMTPSRIIKRKGIKEIVLAMMELPEYYYLCLPGAYEPLDKRYWQSIVDHPAYTTVKQRIIVPARKLLYDEMPMLYAASDLIAMPSYYEGAPVATVEAMASGKPFVGAAGQGITSFIRHEQNGLLVPIGTVKELAQAIQRLDNDGPLKQRLSSQARKDIEYLSWPKQLPELLQTYKGLIKESKNTMQLRSQQLVI
jgi:glycosyltransferase involved in cell wall biosynthesis